MNAAISPALVESPSDRPAALSFSWGLILVLAALTAARIAVSVLVPLTEDEAYYRLWAQHFAFGYFDHPPMVAWWIGAGRALLGDSPLGDRIVAVAATTGVSLLIVDLAQVLKFSRVVSERAALWYNCAFLITLGGAVITPDAPATFFWTVTLWAVARAWRSGAGAWWIGAGVAGGLAALSKYSALFIGPGVMLWLLSSARGRRQLAGPWPWMALAAAVLVFSPNLIWNAQHHWMSISKQFSRIAPSGFTPQHVLDFPATQFVLLNPLIAVFAVRGLTMIRWRPPDADGASLLPIGITPFALYLVAHSFHDGVQAHWPAPLYPTLAIVAAYASAQSPTPFWRRAAAATPWLGLCASAVILIHIVLPQTDGLLRKDPVMPLRGWPQFARDLEQTRRSLKAGWIGTLSYGTAAELEAQRETAAPVLELIERARYGFEGRQPEPSGAGLVVELSRRIGEQDLTPCFALVRRIGEIRRSNGRGLSVAYTLFDVANPTVRVAADGCRVGKDRPQTTPRRTPSDPA